MKKIQLITLLLLSLQAMSQKVKVSPVYKMTELDNRNNPSITGYEVSNKQLKVYGMMPVSGNLERVDKKGFKLFNTYKAVRNRLLFIENVIDLSSESMLKRTQNTILDMGELSEPMKFEVDEKANRQGLNPLTNDMVSRVITMNEMHDLNPNYFPWGKVANKYLYGSFESDFLNKIDFIYRPLIREYQKPIEKPYYKPYVERIKKDGDKYYGKLNFYLKFNDQTLGEVNFKYTKDILRSSAVYDLLGEFKGFIFCFENEKTKNEELNDPNFKNITVVYIDGETNAKTMTELSFDNDVKRPFVDEKFLFDQGKLIIYYTSSGKNLYNMAFIDKEGKNELLEIPLTSRKIYNLYTKSPDYEYGGIHKTDEYHYFDKYQLEIGTVKKDNIGGTIGMNNSRPKIMKYLNLSLGGVIPLKTYIYEVSFGDEVYPIPNTKYCLVVNGDIEFLLEIVDNDIKVHDLNSGDFKRPAILMLKDRFVQDDENIYFVYENGKGGYITMTVKK
jgi:hypothetical protein